MHSRVSPHITVGIWDTGDKLIQSPWSKVASVWWLPMPFKEHPRVRPVSSCKVTMRKIVLLESLCLSLSLLFFLEIHFIVASCTMLLFLILQVDARVLVFSAAGMATRCPATGVDKNNPAQLRHSYGTASSSREICDDIRNATTNPLAVHSTNKPLLGRKTQLYHHMQLPG